MPTTITSIIKIIAVKNSSLIFFQNSRKLLFVPFSQFMRSKCFHICAEHKKPRQNVCSALTFTLTTKCSSLSVTKNVIIETVKNNITRLFLNRSLTSCTFSLNMENVECVIFKTAMQLQKIFSSLLQTEYLAAY